MSTEDLLPFGVLLRQYRAAAGLSQEELAARAGLTFQGIGLLERGQRRYPQARTVQQLADALGLTDAARARFIAAAHTRPSMMPHVSPKTDRDRVAPLPVPPTALLGREADVARIRALLCADEAASAHGRLVTLTGPGGVGKTRLGLAVAQSLQNHFFHGIVYVSLAPLADPALIPTAIAHALNVVETGGQALLDGLITALREQHLLLVLDNFEHVLAAAPLVADFLAACPRLHVLVTSRAPLHLRGERQVRVESLALPDAPALHQLDARALARYAAVALFVARAQDVRGDFQLTAGNAQAVAAICAHVDGLPLAIEFAAARVTLLSPQALLARLDRRLPVLVHGARDLPERQRTLRATLAWSYDLLHPGEQALFRRLAVFVGGGTVEAVMAVCGSGDALEDDVLEWLQGLVDQSLLRVDDGMTGEPRVVMLETVREYGLEQLAMSGECDTIQRQHALYYLGLAETAERELQGAGQAAWIVRLGVEQENLRAAAWRLVDLGEAEKALALAGSLWWYWETAGRRSAGRDLLTALLAAPRALARTVERSKALTAAGLLATFRGDLASARAYLEESLAIATERGDQHYRAMALMSLGWQAHDQIDLATARLLLEESLAMFRTLGDWWGTANALIWLGHVVREQGEPGMARGLFEDALAIRQAMSDQQGIAAALSGLADVCYVQGDRDSARMLQEKSLTLQRALGERANTWWSLYKLGNFALEQNDAALANARYTEALTLAHEIGDWGCLATILQCMAALALVAGQPTRTLRLAAAAATLREKTDRPLAGQVQWAHHIEQARGMLGDTASKAAWAQGRAMSLEQAIAEAVEEGRTDAHGEMFNDCGDAYSTGQAHAPGRSAR